MIGLYGFIFGSMYIFELFEERLTSIWSREGGFIVNDLYCIAPTSTNNMTWFEPTKG